MSGVREIIELLSRILCSHGISEIKAESFRSAKFDKDIAAPNLWRLLFELVLFLRNGIVDENPEELINSLKTEELVAFTKCVMQDHGYLSEDFSQLPNDMMQGSREILLAVGWLISTKKVIDHLIEAMVLPVNQEFPNAHCVVLNESRFKQNNKSDIVPRIKQLQLLNGQLQLSLKKLYSLYREETKLQHRVHESTIGVGSLSHKQHLSVFETHLLRHPEQLKKCLKLVEKDNTRLEYIVHWKEHEQIFWHWMESVLQLKMEEKSPRKTPQQLLHYNIPSDLIGKVSVVRKDLETKIMKLDPVITQLDELWETKQNELSTESLRKLDTAVRSEINLLKKKINNDMFNQHNSGLSNLYQNSRLVYTKPQKKKVHTVQIPELMNAEEENLIDLQCETDKLMEHITRLECEVRRKERYYKTVLDELAANIPGAICIQPALLRQSKN